MLRTHYGADEADTKKVGIARLLRKRCYKAAYPLHDGRWEDDADDNVESGQLQKQQLRGGGAPMVWPAQRTFTHPLSCHKG